MDEIVQESGPQAPAVEQVGRPVPAPPLLNTRHILILGLVGGCVGIFLTILSTQGILPSLFMLIGIGITVATFLSVIILFLLFHPNLAHVAQMREEAEGRGSMRLSSLRPADIHLEEPIAADPPSSPTSQDTEHYIIRDKLSTIMELTSTSEEKELSSDCVPDPVLRSDVEDASEDPCTSDSKREEPVETQPTEGLAESAEGNVQSSADEPSTSKSVAEEAPQKQKPIVSSQYRFSRFSPKPASEHPFQKKEPMDS